MKLNVYSSSANKIGKIKIRGGRIKHLDYSIPDYSLESFVTGDGTHQIDTEGNYDLPYTIEKIDKNSNEGMSDLTYLVVCPSLSDSLYLKLNWFQATYIKWNTRQHYFRDESFKKDLYKQASVGLISAIISAIITYILTKC